LAISGFSLERICSDSLPVFELNFLTFCYWVVEVFLPILDPCPLSGLSFSFFKCCLLRCKSLEIWWSPTYFLFICF
jgi:hypothetical protein